MRKSQNNAVRNHRRRLRSQGLRRVEVQAAESDAQLIRCLASVLRDDEQRATQLRQQLHEIIGAENSAGLKALLAEAPLEGIKITRSRDRGRRLEL